MSSVPDERPMRERMAEYVLDLQNRIVTALESIDPTAPPFKRDEWTRDQGGYGISCVFPPSSSPSTDEEFERAGQHTTVLEKGGVNVSIIHGTLPSTAVRQMRADHAALRVFDHNDPELEKKRFPFFAAGLSLVIHPRNPNAPTVHCNYRYFELSEPEPASPPTSTSTATATTTTDAPPAVASQILESSQASGTLTGIPLTQKPLAWWFGGGADLTPSYLFPSDANHFHQTLKSACDTHGPILYPSFKKWCDEYFFITHRGEARGIGGIFFDDLCDAPHKRLAELSGDGVGEGKMDVEGARPTTLEGIFSFVKSCGDAFNPSYIPILTLRKAVPYTPKMRHWQLLRRGRYVEFNLVHDRGTKFGLMTPGARIESILMSLPALARWEYRSEMGVEESSEEGKLVEVLKNPKEWV